MKKGHFTGDFEELRILSGLPGICAGVYYFLKNSRNMAKRNEITKMQDNMSEYFGCHKNTIYNAIKSLREAGLITVRRKGRLNSYGFPMADGIKAEPEKDKEAMDTKPEETGTTEPEIQMTGEMTDNFSDLPTIYIKEEEIMNQCNYIGNISDIRRKAGDGGRNREMEEMAAIAAISMSVTPDNVTAPSPAVEIPREKETREQWAGRVTEKFTAVNAPKEMNGVKKNENAPMSPPGGYSAATVRDYEIIMKDSFVRDRTWTNMRVFRSRPDSEKIEILKGCLSASTYFYDMHPSRKNEVMGYLTVK